MNVFKQRVCFIQKGDGEGIEVQKLVDDLDAELDLDNGDDDEEKKDKPKLTQVGLKKNIQEANQRQDADGEV